MPSALLAASDETAAETVAKCLKRRGFGVVRTRSAAEAVTLLGTRRPPFGLVYVETRLGDGAGAPVIAAARATIPPTPVLVGSEAKGDRAGEDCVTIERPFGGVAIEEAIDKALARP